MVTTLLKVDISKLERLEEDLGRIGGEAIGASVVAALNQVVGTSYDLARDRMSATVNLSDSYLRRKMVVVMATNQKPVASITASGAREDMTLLSEYLKMQRSTNVNWSNQQIAAMGKKFGKWPGWTRRTGNQALGIAVNKKAAGQSASVLKSSRAELPHAFSIPGKKDGSGNLIMFSSARGGGKKAKIRALHGPAVYQLFKTQIPNIEGEIGDDLEAELLERLEQEIEKVFE